MFTLGRWMGTSSQGLGFFFVFLASYGFYGKIVTLLRSLNTEVINLW